MKSKQKRFGHAKILCLVLSLLLMVSMIPLGTTFASAEDGEETSSEVTQTEESVEPSESTEPEESEPDGEPEESGEPENTTYANSISGVLWIDANEDGTYDAGEQPLADYPVYLYAENDQVNAVDTDTTDADGKYEFINISPGRYVVGIKAEENGTEYLLPLVGVQKDNKFYFAPDWSKVISNPIDIAADTVVEDIYAAMRTMPHIQPMAGSYVDEIDVGAATTAITISTSGTYRLYGTTTSNTRIITVATGVTATFDLDGVSMTCSTSPFRLNGTANATLYLMDGTVNTFTCSTQTSSVGAIYAGIYVQQTATLTIQGEGTLSASGGYGCAGIGGIWTSTSSSPANGTVIINSGTIIASRGRSGGASIGGGAYGAGGTITINGGNFKATYDNGSSQGAGIGGGQNGSGGTITITGGTVITPGSSSTATGIGAGLGGSTGTTTITITGGSVLPTNLYGVVSTSHVPINGSANGSQTLYMTTVTVVDASNIPVEGALVSIANNPTSNYTYEAYTNASGIAYIWVPVRSNVLFEAQHDDYGYGAETTTVAANNNNAVTIVLGMRTTLSRTPGTIAFISTADPTPVTLGVKAENKDTGALKDIIGAQWFRVETTDTTYTASKTSFDSGYAAASSSNKGDDTTNLIETAGGDSSEKNYTMPVSENGIYWVMVHYKDGLGVDRYQVKSIVIDNVYTPSTLTYKGVNVSNSSEIVFPSTDYTGAGVAYQLNSATIIYSTADGTTAVSGTGAQITLTAPDQTPYWITPSPASYSVDVDGVALGEKVFTYAKDPAWWVTITYAAVMDTGSNVSIVSNTNPTSIKLNVARTNVGPNVNAAALNIELVGYRDSNSATPTAVIPITTAFTPSANTTITFVYRNVAVNLTISKTVTGAYANMEKASTFTVTLLESDGVTPLTGTFNYTGGVIAGSGATAPANGTLTLGSGGEATVTLTTGQTITIAGVATSAKVRVVQTTDANYTTSFKDSLDAGSTSSADTGVRSMTAADRTFDYTNTRSVVPGGISTGSGEMVLLSLMALLALASGLAITAAYLRRRAGAR